jgi:hypothetical protein
MPALAFYQTYAFLHRLSNASRKAARFTTMEMFMDNANQKNSANRQGSKNQNAQRDRSQQDRPSSKSGKQGGSSQHDANR